MALDTTMAQPVPDTHETWCAQRPHRGTPCAGEASHIPAQTGDLLAYVTAGPDGGARVCVVADGQVSLTRDDAVKAAAELLRLASVAGR